MGDNTLFVDVLFRLLYDVREVINMQKTFEDFSVFGDNIQTLRRKYGLSQTAMAKKLHVGINTLQALEKGPPCPNVGIKIFSYIQEEFGVQPSLMFIPEMEEW